MQIVIDDNNVVLQCSAGGLIEGGIEVDNIPDEVFSCPNKWVYSDVEVVGEDDAVTYTAGYSPNANYVEPASQSTDTQIPEIIAKIDELQASVDLLILDTL